MKVLFVACKSADYLSSVLWDGLQEVLGEENVFDAVNCPLFHESDADLGIYSTLSATRRGRHLCELRGNKVDLMVINASFLREQDWHWPINLKNEFLRTGGKVAYVESWDGADEIHVPNMPVDAVFRREIDPSISYPYEPHCFMMAAPSRWFVYNDARPIDVFFAGYAGLNSRWDTVREMLRTQKFMHAIICTGAFFGFEEYASFLSLSKLGICPAGGGDDCLRTWETVARGAIPVFVNQMRRVREPWFTSCVTCSTDSLASIVEGLLGSDLTAFRNRMQQEALENHTTAARAKRLLDIVGV